RPLAELVDFHGDAVRQLFVQQLERRFADELRGEEAGGLGRHLVGVVVERAFGERGAQRTQQAVQASTGEGRDNGSGGCWRLLEVGEVGGGRGEIGFRVDGHDRGSGRTVQFRYFRQRGGRILRERVQ